jgi:Protein of unknown function (DUF3800)
MRAYYDELALGLGWSNAEQILMIWAYYDESGEYDSSGKLLNMTIGGCISTADKWKVFDGGWRKMLETEGLPFFHMTDFQAWKPPFDFVLADGKRDKEKHNRVMNTVLALMLDNIEGLYGYGAVSMYQHDRHVTHRTTMDCVGGAVKDVVLRIWEDYEQPINLVFAKQDHFPASWVDKYAAFYDYGEAQGRTGSVSHCPADKVPALQAADVLAYELARAQRADRPERYPYQRLVDGAKARALKFSITWGPIRSKRLNLSGGGESWG